MFIVVVSAAALSGCGGGGSKVATDPGSNSVSTADGAPGGEAPDTASDDEPVDTASRVPFVQETFPVHQTIHFVSSDPPANSLLTTRPKQVTINFNCDLGSGSFISVTRDGQEMVTGSMAVSADSRSITAALSPYITTGNYKVEYAAYWRDGSFCEGYFGFSVKLPE